jgi:glycogen operon protein
LDTAQASPADITSRAGQRPHSAFHYPVAPRSVVVLEAR